MFDPYWNDYDTPSYVENRTSCCYGVTKTYCENRSPTYDTSAPSGDCLFNGSSNSSRLLDRDLSRIPDLVRVSPDSRMPAKFYNNRTPSRWLGSSNSSHSAVSKITRTERFHHSTHRPLSNNKQRGIDILHESFANFKQQLNQGIKRKLEALEEQNGRGGVGGPTKRWRKKPPLSNGFHSPLSNGYVGDVATHHQHQQQQQQQHQNQK